MARKFLLTGFGPFLDVTDNPSGRLAALLNGALLEDVSELRRPPREPVQVCGKVLAVRYDTCAAETLLAAKQIGAVGILGMGVARGATAPRVERTGRAAVGPTPDAGGVIGSTLGSVPERRSAHADALAAALGLRISDDAGAYVCNAWLYGVLGGTTLPGAFLHLPDQGMDPDALLRGLATWISGFEDPD